MQIVRVKNPTDSTFTSKFDNESYTIPAGSESIVPIGAMIRWCGNPELRNINARQRFRVEELTRLKTKYGAYENEKLWERNKPRIEFYTMEGERIWTVVDDPDGEKQNTVLSDEMTQTTTTAKLAALENQMAQFLDMVKRGELVLADDTGREDVLDQIEASAEERAAEAEALASMPRSIIVSGPDDGGGPVVSGPPLAGLDDGGEDGEGADEAGRDNLGEEGTVPAGPPTDTPKTVKVGSRKSTTATSATDNES